MRKYKNSKGGISMSEPGALEEWSKENELYASIFGKADTDEDEKLKKYQNVVRSLYLAIDKDDLSSIEQIFNNPLNREIVDKEFLKKLPEHIPYAVSRIKSPEMTALFLSKLDMKDRRSNIFAATLISYAVNKNGAQIDEMIAIAKKYNISLVQTANNGNLEVVNKCLKSGMNVQSFDLSEAANWYYRYKDGYMKEKYKEGPDAVESIVPQPDKAKEQKRIILAVLNAGYKVNMEKERTADFGVFPSALYRFISEISQENSQLNKMKRSL